MKFSIKQNFYIETRLLVLARETTAYTGEFSSSLSLKIYNELRSDFGRFDRSSIMKLLNRIVEEKESIKGLDQKIVNYIGY